MCACIGAGLCKATEGNAPWKGEAREGRARIGSCPLVTTHLPSLCKLPVAQGKCPLRDCPPGKAWRRNLGRRSAPGLAQ